MLIKNEILNLTIHCNPLTDTLNSLPIDGKATCTIVKSTTAINCTKAISANIIDSCDEEPTLVVIVGEFSVILKFRK